jgi:hypothetical protein
MGIVNQVAVLRQGMADGSRPARGVLHSGARKPTRARVSAQQAGPGSDEG